MAGLEAIAESVDGVFDAASGVDHRAHWDLLQSWGGKWVVDLTPPKLEN